MRGFSRLSDPANPLCFAPVRIWKQKDFRVSSRITYRPDIDGIRALAVLSVILYHLDISLFKGGYIGVDVFFVISGYLITKIITAEVERTGSFSFASFYANRVKRLLPAFLLTVSATFVAAFVLYSPADFARFGGELFSSLLSVSNIFFWTDSGYFDASSSVKPLLHTWSLAVEEQFYLVWPALVVLAVSRFKRAGLTALAIVLFMASLYLNSAFITPIVDYWPSIPGRLVELMRDQKSTAFYLLPFRVFEFAIGALVVVLERRSMPNILRELCVLAGFVMVAATAILIDDAVFFPGYYALIPCVGTALMIIGNSQNFSRALGWKPLVFIGLLSYSAYLVHWPLIVFYKYSSLSEIDLGAGSLILFATFALAAIMYRYIERPFRSLKVMGHAIPQRAFIAVCVLISVCLILPARDIWKSDGWSWRIDPDVREALALVKGQVESVVSYKKEVAKKVAPTEDFTSSGKIKVLIVGDSYSGDVTAALRESKNSDQYEIRHFQLGHFCQPLFTDYRKVENWPYKSEANNCNEITGRLSRSSLWAAADKVVIVARWYDWAGPYIESTFAEYRRKSTGSIVIFGRKEEFLPTIPALLNKRGTSTAFEKFLYAKAERRERPIENVIRETSEKIGARYVDFGQIQCSTKSHSCDAFDAQGRALYWDYAHWTVEGIRHFANAVEAAIRKG